MNATTEAHPEEPSPLQLALNAADRVRRVLVWTALVAITGMMVTWAFSAEVFAFLARPLTDALAARGLDERLTFTHLTDPFILYFTVSMFGGLTVALPVLLAQIFVALSPRLRPRRLLGIGFVVVSATVLFLAGATFCYLVLIPFAVGYLLDVGSDFEQFVTVRDFLRFALRLLFALGLAAELPLVTALGARAGILSAALLRRGLPYAFVLSFILAAWITPPDGLSQILVAVPLVTLYLVGIVVAWLVQR